MCGDSYVAIAKFSTYLAVFLFLNLGMDIAFSGIDLPFEWDELEAFVRQPDGSLFSWCERFHCYNHILDGIVSCFVCWILMSSSFSSQFLHEARKINTVVDIDYRIVREKNSI